MMDAVEFLKEAKKMCKDYPYCVNCPADTTNCLVNIFQNIGVDNVAGVTNAVAMVEKWSKEHSRKTRNSEFLKHYPSANVLDNGVVSVCPKLIEHYSPSANCYDIDCYDCKTEYWMQEVE